MTQLRILGLFALLVIALGWAVPARSDDPSIDLDEGDDMMDESVDMEEEEDEAFDEGMAGSYPGADSSQGMLGLTPEDATARMTEIFVKIDADGDGFMSVEEATVWAKRADSLAKDVHGESEFETLDTNKDGFISLEEMLALYNQYDQDGATEEDKKFGAERFHAIDEDGSGHLDVREIRILLDPGKSAKLVDVEAAGIMRAQDKNKDGGIDFVEYADTAEEKLNADEVAALKKDFGGFDKSGDGKIDEDEVKEVIRSMGAVELQRGIDEIMSIMQTEEEKANKETPTKISQADFLENIKKTIMSVITADGDLVRVPEKYPSLELSFKNAEIPKSQGFGDDVDHNDAMFGDMTDEKIADLMKQFKSQDDSGADAGEPEIQVGKDEL